MQVHKNNFIFYRFNRRKERARFCLFYAWKMFLDGVLQSIECMAKFNQQITFSALLLKYKKKKNNNNL